MSNIALIFPNYRITSQALHLLFGGHVSHYSSPHQDNAFSDVKRNPTHRRQEIANSFTCKSSHRPHFGCNTNQRKRDGEEKQTKKNWRGLEVLTATVFQISAKYKIDVRTVLLFSYLSWGRGGIKRVTHLRQGTEEETRIFFFLFIISILPSFELSASDVMGPF